MTRHLAVLICMAAFCCTTKADQVTLNNGDRLTGTIVKSDAGELLLSTEYAGQIKIDWGKVRTLTTTTPVHLQLKDGRTLQGAIVGTDDTWKVQEPNGAQESIAKNNVALIRGQAEQTAFEQAQHPGLRQNWEGGANLGFALTRGNSESKNLAISFTADRKTLNDKIAMYANSVYATNDAPGAVPSTTANAVRGGIRYDHDITKRLFGFVSADFATDELQNLDLRSAFGGGLGYHVINTSTTTLDLLGGLNYTHEAYSTFSRNFPAAIIGEEFTHKIAASTVITEKLGFFPDLSDLGEYRGTFDLGTVTKINKWLGWQNSFSDVYVTNPPFGKKKNDIILTTGLSITFVRRTEAGSSK